MLLRGTCRLDLDRDLVVSIDCRPCGNSRPILQPIQLVSVKQAVCPDCGEPAKAQVTHWIEEGTDLAEQPLRRLGVPSYDIVRVTTEAGQRVLLLAGDRQSALAGEIVSIGT